MGAVCALYGGVSICEQIKQLKKGMDVIIATPGRLIECLCTNSGRLLDIRYVSYFVMDEADRLFDLGFESQITSILNNVRPDKQLIMFSATFPRKIEKIARRYFLNSADAKTKTMQITIGSAKHIYAPCSNMAQFVYICESEEEKFKALLRLLSEWYGRGNILIFESTRSGVDALFGRLCDAGYFCLTLHGGINQIDRDYTMIDFKAKTKTILICTSVASRGLDVEDLRVVINYFPPHHYEDYVHRIGRTGRAQQRGVAYTFINKCNLTEEAKCIPHIVRAMKASNIGISEELNELYLSYFDDINNGKQTLHRNAGYDGKGFKYDRSELNEKKKQIERQKYVYGQKEELQEWNLNKNEVEEVKKTEFAQNGKQQSLEEELAAIKRKAIEDKKAANPLNRNLETLKKALLAAKRKKKRLKAKADESVLRKTIDRTILNEKKKHEKNTKDRVETIAKIISMSFDSSASAASSLSNNSNDKDGVEKIFKVDINGYPANARKALTYSNNLLPIKENYNVRITQKGTFQKGKVPKGQSSLYLEVKGTNISNIHGAIKELQQILHREAAKANHSMQHSNNRYSKFKVV